MACRWPWGSLPDNLSHVTTHSYHSFLTKCGKEKKRRKTKVTKYKPDKDEVIGQWDDFLASLSMQGVANGDVTHDGTNNDVTDGALVVIPL